MLTTSEKQGQANERLALLLIGLVSVICAYFNQRWCMHNRLDTAGRPENGRTIRLLGPSFLDL